VLSGLHGLPERSGKLKDLTKFDASYFGVHPKQAHAMDPQLRLLLEVTHEAIVDAGKCIFLMMNKEVMFIFIS
jgi:fatty acid synthase